ncbi:MAG: selenocysteine-specific translation elongation factor [Gemmatimonadota bacterium]
MILGTAGHIDHGKTALVHALTGVWTDRLKEERERGISIDLGFAHWDAAPGLRIGVVDVPGHQDFIRNMVAGASGVDAALFVVSAEEGMMPQSREHLEILRQLGVGRGVVALTKRDLVEPEWLELVSASVAQELAGSFLEHAPAIAVSARTGAGLGELRRAILALFAGPGPEADARLELGFRLPVDRAFTVHGVGTVVTGTPGSGRLELDDVVRLLPAERTARVRSIQSHGETTAHARRGRRTAVALGGAEREWAPRGSVLVTGEQWRAARLWQARVEFRPSAARELRSGTRVRVLLGTAEVIGRLTLEAGASPMRPGGVAFGQLRLEGDLVAALGDRFVLRSFSPLETLGGGEVLCRSTRRLGPRRLAEAAPLHRALRSSDPAERLSAVVAERGTRGIPLAEAAFRAGLAGEPRRLALAALEARGEVVAAGGRLFPAAAVDVLRGRLLAELAAFHSRERIRRGLPLSELRERARASAPLVDRVLGELVTAARLVVEHHQVRLASDAGALGGRETEWRDALLERYARSGLEPPDPAQAITEIGAPPREGRALLDRLVEEARLTKLGAGLYFHAAPLLAARERVRALLAGRPAASVGELKDLLGVSRKYLIPLLEHFDREGLTRRTPAGRTLARP